MENKLALVSLLGAVIMLGIFGTHMLSELAILLKSALGPGTSENVTRVDDLAIASGRALDQAFVVMAPILIGGIVLE